MILGRRAGDGGDATGDIVEVGNGTVTETMTIDGNLTEQAWRDAEAIPFHVPVTHAIPHTLARGRLCWDANYLYVAFESPDEDMKGTGLAQVALLNEEGVQPPPPAQ